MSLQGSSGRVLVAPDKLKGSMSAHEAAIALAAGIRREGIRDRDDSLATHDGLLGHRP